MGNIKEALTEIIDYIQACREAGETDLIILYIIVNRPTILAFVDSLLIEYGNKEKAKEDKKSND